MHHEVAFQGLFYPSLLLCAIIAGICWYNVDMVMKNTSLWLAFWHQPLAKLALYFVIFGLESALYPDF